ncbi:MAG: hypothetical protein ACI4DK_01490 [Lachnospiraceae bacterium]
MKRKRILALLIALSVLTGNIAASDTNAYAAPLSNEEKEEVVYIMTDANGLVENVNVVNIFGKGDVTDYGDYSLVKMLTTTDDISQNGDVITFSTDQEKVYYQGTMENVEIPWNINITYWLDGKEISPKQLAGQSGDLKIYIKVTENEKCNHNYYEEYALQATLTLDTQNCKNITADGATMANVGSYKQIAYTALPGQGIDTVIHAKVTDFEMDAIAINGIKLNLDMDIDDEELMDKVTEIMDASKKINDGAIELSDGASELSDGGDKVNQGAQSLYDATALLNSGVSSLSQGTTAMQEALNSLNSNSASLTSGSKQVKEALATIQMGLSNVSMSTEQIKQLTDSSSAINQAIAEIYNGLTALQANVSYAAYVNALNQNGLDINALKAQNDATIQSLTAQISDLQLTIQSLSGVPGYEDQVAQLNAQVTQLSNVIALLNANNAAIGGTEAYFQNLSSGVDALVAGMAELKTNYEKFDAAILSLSTQLTDLAVNMSVLKGGIDQLVANYATLDNGIIEYTNGVAMIVANYSKLVDGVGALGSGSKQLLEGTGTLKRGTADLYSGILSLQDGTNELYDGTDEFYEKTSDMDQQVEDSIDEMIASISGEETETVSFASEKNTNVESVQFVIKSAAIQKPEEETVEETEDTKKSFWDKIKLLGKD